MNLANARPGFTIALPTYNRPDTTREAIDSCLAQDYPDFEILISDDTPGDAIRDLVRTYESDRIIYVKNEPALGIPAKLNDQLARARKDWMVILGDDDLFAPDFLRRVADAIAAHPDTTLVHARSRLVDAQGRMLSEDRQLPGAVDPADALQMLFRPWYVMRVSLTGFAFPVERMRAHGGFRHFHQGYFVDNLAWAAMAAQGRTCFLEESLVTLRESTGSLGHRYDPPLQALLASRVQVVDALDEVIEPLVRRTGDPAARERILLARNRCVDFIHDDTRHVLYRSLRAVTPGPTAAVRSTVQTICAAIEHTQPALLDARWFRGLLRYFTWVAAWPEALRRLAFAMAHLVVGTRGRLRRGGRGATAR